jgi:hypothetical protein
LPARRRVATPPSTEQDLKDAHHRWCAEMDRERWSAIARRFSATECVVTVVTVERGVRTCTCMTSTPYKRSRDSSVGTYTTLQTGRPRCDSRQWQECSFCSTPFRSALGPTQPRIQSVPESLSPGIKCLRREAHKLTSPCAEVKNGGVIPPLPHTPSWRALD